MYIVVCLTVFHLHRPTASPGICRGLGIEPGHFEDVQPEAVRHCGSWREREWVERQRVVSQWSAVFPISPFPCLKDLSLKTMTFDPEEGSVCWLKALSYCRPTHLCIWNGMDLLLSLENRPFKVTGIFNSIPDPLREYTGLYWWYLVMQHTNPCFDKFIHCIKIMF